MVDELRGKEDLRQRLETCINALRLVFSHPSDDRDEIWDEKTKKNKGWKPKGLKDTKDELSHCRYILNQEAFQRWSDYNLDPQLLWISGGLGMGKTMLTFFLLRQLERDQHHINSECAVLYYFVSKKDDNRNSVVAILRGLILLLLEARKDLVNHLYTEYSVLGTTLFNKDPSALNALWRVFSGMVRDKRAKKVFCVIDGLDECQEAMLGPFLQRVTGFFKKEQDTWDKIRQGAVDSEAVSRSKFRLVLLSRESPSCLTDNLASWPHIQLEFAQLGKKTKPKDTATSSTLNVNTTANAAQKLSEVARLMIQQKKLASSQAGTASSTNATANSNAEGRPLLNGLAAREDVEQQLEALKISASASQTPGREGVESTAVELAADPVVNPSSAALGSEGYVSDPVVQGDEAIVSEAVGQEGEEEDDGPLQNLALCHYVEDRVEELSQIRGYSKEIEEIISSSLQEGGDGSFLWVDLAAEDLLLQEVHNVAQVAQQLPKSVNEMYCRALRRIPEHTVPLVVVLFRWVLAALRPMTVDEISTALLHMGFATANPVEMVQYGVAACSSMLGINEETNDVHIQHTSVQDFLTEKTGLLWTDAELYRFHVNVEECDGEIASLCIRYLEQGCLHAGPIAMVDGDRYWQRVGQFPLLPYATLYWSDHLRTATRPQVDISSPFFVDQSPIRKNWWQTFYPATTGQDPLLTPRSFGVLHMAAALNLVSVAQQLEFRGELGRRINNKDSHGSSALHWAVVMGNMEMFTFLLQRGASRECVGETIFELACRKGQQEIVEYLLNVGQDVNARAADPMTVKGISKATRWIHGKVSEGQILELDFWKLLVRDTGAGGTALHTACLCGHTAVAELLIRRGAYVQMATTKGWTALHSASWRGQMDCVKLLLDHGANPMEVTQDGWNSLHCAASRGKHAVVSFYLTKGIPVDAVTKKRKTALHHAAYSGSAATVSVLVKAGAFINAQSHKGETPLHLAARASEPEVVELLLAMGANRYIPNSAGQTAAEGLRAIWGALVANQKETLRILDQYGMPGYVPWKPKDDPKAATSAQVQTIPESSSATPFTTEWQCSATTAVYPEEKPHPARSQTLPLVSHPTPGLDGTGTYSAPPPYTPSPAFPASQSYPQEKPQQAPAPTTMSSLSQPTVQATSSVAPVTQPQEVPASTPATSAPTVQAQSPPPFFTPPQLIPTLLHQPQHIVPTATGSPPLANVSAQPTPVSHPPESGVTATAGPHPVLVSTVPSTPIVSMGTGIPASQSPTQLNSASVATPQQTAPTAQMPNGSTAGPVPQAGQSQGAPPAQNPVPAPASGNGSQAFGQQASQPSPSPVPPASQQWASSQPAQAPPYNPHQVQIPTPPITPQATSSSGPIPQAYPFPVPAQQQPPAYVPPQPWRPPASSPLAGPSPNMYPPTPPQQPPPSYSAYPPQQHQYSVPPHQHPQVQQPQYHPQTQTQTQTQPPFPYAYPHQPATATSPFLSAGGYAPTGSWQGAGQPYGYHGGVVPLQKKKSILSFAGIEISKK